jgi:hypothetical protein
MAGANEREAAKALVPHLPPGGVVLFDRGYPSYDLIRYLLDHYTGYWVIRCPASSTFPAVAAFARSGQPQAAITLAPPKGEPVRLRAIRLVSPEGELSVLLTNLPDQTRFSADAVVALYFRRWAVDIYQPYNLRKSGLAFNLWRRASGLGGRWPASTATVPVRRRRPGPAIARAIAG